MTDDRFALWDGAYVLGSLSTSDRHDYEDHLRECERCSAAVAEFAALPGLLGAVPRDVALAEPSALPTPAAGGADRLFDRIRTRHRRTRARDCLVAATVALAIAVPATLVAQHHDSPDEVALRPMTDVVPTVIDAGVGLTRQSWGTTVTVECSYRTDEPSSADQYGTETEQYALTVTDSAGRVTRLATWIGRPGATVRPTGTTSITADALRRIDIRATDTDDILLTAPA